MYRTCDGKNYASKRDPAVVLVALEKRIDVVGVDSFEYRGIILGNVVNANEGDAQEPDGDAGGKGVAHLISSEPLH